MKEPLSFTVAVIRHWGVVVTSGVLIGGIGLWQSTGHFVGHWVYWSVGAVGLIVAFYRAWLNEHQSVLELIAELDTEATKSSEATQYMARLHEEIDQLKGHSHDEKKKELVKAITLLHSMQSNVMYWKDIVKDKWGMAPAAVKLLPDDWSAVVYSAENISQDLRKRVDVLEELLVRANATITQFLNVQINFRDQKLMLLAYGLLDQAAPQLFSVTAEFEGFESSLRSKAGR
jgi:hypothetical protein